MNRPTNELYSVDSQPDRCARACEHCAALCDHTLQADPTYRNSIERFTEGQLAMISFASVCRLTANAIRERRADAADMCSWCSTVCQDFAEQFGGQARTWRRFDAAVRNCASLCASVAQRAQRGYGELAPAGDAPRRSASRRL